MTKARSNAVANAAKGDLTVGSGTNLSGVLAVGSNGDTIVADNSTATGLRWQGSAIAKNALYNSAFDIFQRTSAPTTGITISGGSGYTLDRYFTWTIGGGGSMVVSQQATGDTTNLPFVRYCARVRRATSNTNTEPLIFGQSLENSDSARFIGQTVTFSFYARKGSGYSPTSSLLNANVYYGTGTDANPQTGAASASAFSGNATLTTTWQRFQFTGTIPTSAKQVSPLLQMTPTGTAGADDYYEVTGLQLELGSIATPFNRQSGSIQGELDACRRYFVRYGGNTTTEFFGAGMAYAAGSVFLYVPHRPFMRTSPVGTFAAGSNFRMFNSTMSGAAAATGVAADTYSPTGSTLLITGGSGLTAGNASSIQSNLTTSGTLDFSAEL